MEDAGLDFRSTRDLDIVLCIEALDLEFAKAFWQFIKDGNYKNRQQSTGKHLFYRFYAPNNQEFPDMLELFSRRIETIRLNADSHLTPIPLDEEISSLSAILLDDDYYELIHKGKCEIEGLSTLKPEYLIPLKAKAWLDLDEKHKAGAKIDEKTVRKHKNDVVRLYQLLSMSQRHVLPQKIREDMQKFLNCLKNDESIDLKNFGMKMQIQELADNLHQIYI